MPKAPPRYHAAIKVTQSRLDEVVAAGGIAKVRSLFRGVEADLEKALAKIPSGSFDHARRSSALLQVKAALLRLRDESEGAATSTAVDAQLAAIRTLGQQVAELEHHFTGAVQPVPLLEAGRFRGIAGQNATSLLVQHRTSMARYGAAVVQKIEGVMAHSMLAGDQNTEAVDKIMETFGGERWQAERIHRTEAAWSYAAGAAAGIQAQAEAMPDLRMRWCEHVVDATGQPMDDRVAVDSLAMHGQVTPPGGVFTQPPTAPDGEEVPAGLVLETWPHPPNRPNDRAVVQAWRPHWRVPAWIWQGKRVPYTGEPGAVSTRPQLVSVPPSPPPAAPAPPAPISRPAPPPAAGPRRALVEFDPHVADSPDRQDADSKLEELGLPDVATFASYQAVPDGFSNRVDEAHVMLDGNVVVSGQIIDGKTQKVAGHWSRTIASDGTWVKHGSLNVEPEYRGRGISDSMNAAAFEHYAAMGVREVRTTAAWIGRYQWMRLGFQPTPAERKEITKKFRQWAAKKPKLRAHADALGDKVAEMLEQPGGIAGLDVAGVKVKIASGHAPGEYPVGKAFLLDGGVTGCPIYDATIPLQAGDPFYEHARARLGKVMRSVAVPGAPRVPAPRYAMPPRAPGGAPGPGDVERHVASGDLGAARSAIDASLRAAGMRPRGATGEVKVRELPPGVDASADWQGRITLADTTAARLDRFAQQWAEDPQAVRLAYLRQTGDQHLMTDEERRYVAANAAALDQIGFDVVSNLDAARALHHEVIHGFGPTSEADYEGHVAALEEVTTEALARRTVADRYGVPVRRGTGAYQAELDHYVDAIQDAYGVGKAAAWGHLEEAAQRYKALPPGQRGDLAEHFVAGLPEVGDGDDSQRRATVLAAARRLGGAPDEEARAAVTAIDEGRVPAGPGARYKALRQHAEVIADDSQRLLAEMEEAHAAAIGALEVHAAAIGDVSALREIAPPGLLEVMSDVELDDYADEIGEITDAIPDDASVDHEVVIAAMEGAASQVEARARAARAIATETARPPVADGRRYGAAIDRISDAAPDLSGIATRDQATARARSAVDRATRSAVDLQQKLERVQALHVQAADAIKTTRKPYEAAHEAAIGEAEAVEESGDVAVEFVRNRRVVAVDQAEIDHDHSEIEDAAAIVQDAVEGLAKVTGRKTKAPVPAKKAAASMTDAEREHWTKMAHLHVEQVARDASRVYEHEDDLEVEVAKGTVKREDADKMLHEFVEPHRALPRATVARAERGLAGKFRVPASAKLEEYKDKARVAAREFQAVANELDTAQTEALEALERLEAARHRVHDLLASDIEPGEFDEAEFDESLDEDIDDDEFERIVALKKAEAEAKAAEAKKLIATATKATRADDDVNVEIDDLRNYFSGAASETAVLARRASRVGNGDVASDAEKKRVESVARGAYEAATTETEDDEDGDLDKEEQHRRLAAALKEYQEHLPIAIEKTQAIHDLQKAAKKRIGKAIDDIPEADDVLSENVDDDGTDRLLFDLSEEDDDEDEDGNLVPSDEDKETNRAILDVEASYRDHLTSDLSIDEATEAIDEAHDWTKSVLKGLRKLSGVKPPAKSKAKATKKPVDDGGEDGEDDEDDGED